MRLVLDITTSTGWKGPDVGITRVERKLAQHYLKHLSDLPFDLIFVVQDRSGNFAQLDPLVASCELEPLSFQEPQPLPSSSSPSINKADRLLRLIKRTGIVAYSRTLASLPEQAQADFHAVAVHSERTAKHLVHSARHRPKRLSAATEDDQRLHPTGWPGIDSQDTYVSIGLDWDDKSLLNLRELKRNHGFRSIHMIYDMIPTQFPQWLPSEPNLYDCYFTDLLCTADRLLCISETTRKAVIEFSLENSMPCPNTEVVILGADFGNTAQKPIRSLVDQEFILYVSTIEPRKNHRFLLELWTRLLKYGQIPKLVFVGRAGWNCSETLAAIRLLPDLAEHVLLLPTVSDEELTWLYGHCLFTVYPSHYEGWGLPVVESLLSGKLCVASKAEAVVEAGHGLAIHIDTFDGLEWERRILELLNDRSVLRSIESLIANALPEIRTHLSWETYGARATQAIMKNCSK